MAVLSPLPITKVFIMCAHVISTANLGPCGLVLQFIDASSITIPLGNKITYTYKDGSVDTARVGAGEMIGLPVNIVSIESTKEIQGTTYVITTQDETKIRFHTDT